MCGILGSMPESKEITFKKALDTISHRGPDGYGIWHDKGHYISLGHRRLAILDLSELGKQPMHYSNYVITFNGEIYNFIELKKELQTKGFSFKTESDTEVVLAAYQAWGPQCLHKFNGMWAFAIWDTQKKEIFISRDRFGVKPLFYAFAQEKFIFASEMKAIMPFLPSIKPSQDFEWCRDNLFLYEGTDKCLIDGIKRFPAGHWAIVKYGDRHLSPTRFWTTADHVTPPPTKYEEQVEMFRELFLDSCKLRLRADVPVGTSLSGGLDSSAVICSIAYIQQQNKNNLRSSSNWQHAFVATFPNNRLDESYFAQKVVDHLHIKANFLEIDPSSSLNKLNDYLYLFEELYITNPIPMIETYSSMRKAGVIVSMDGHGADELLGGYADDMFRLPRDIGFNISQLQALIKVYNNIISPHSPPDKKEAVSQQNKSLIRNLASVYDFRKLPYYTYKVLSRILKEENVNHSTIKGNFNNHLYKNFHQVVLPTLLRNYDRYSMAAGIEVRMPFMDYRLVNFSFSLPWDSKIRNGYTKNIIRDALKDIMPPEVVWRKSKIGFTAPSTTWMKNQWKDFLNDTIHSKDFETCGLINAKEVKSEIENLIANPNATLSGGEKAWSHLMPYLWQKAVLQNKN